MRLPDLLTLPLAALWQQKLRTLLTTLGVLFGSFVLAASLSIGEGVQETITRESRRSDISRRVDVSPKWNADASKIKVEEVKVEGEMSAPRRERLRKSLAAQKQSDTHQVRSELTRELLAKLAAIPHVARSVPSGYNPGLATLGDHSEGIAVIPARPDDEKRWERLVAGRPFTATDEHTVIVSEFLAYRLGVRDEAAARRLVGKSLQLEFRGQQNDPGIYVSLSKPQRNLSREEREALEKVQARLPGALDKLLVKSEAELLEAAMNPGELTDPETYSEEFTVVGLIRFATEEEAKEERDPYGQTDADLLMPYKTAEELFFKRPGTAGGGMDRATLLVDNEANVKDVVKQVSDLGLNAWAAIEFIERERFMYLLIFSGMTCVAGVALLVSALGIANTMLMSVMERTREIGIMKSVGADNRHLQAIFLIEGAAIGGVGALLGLLLAYAASFPADNWVREMVLRDIKIDLKGSIFVFPPWIALTVVGFTVVVTTLAALYPARHASRIDPVKALRHE